MDELLEEKDWEKSQMKKAKKLIQLERTRTAFERLQLAWVRTALTILAISAGTYEFFYRRLESGEKPLFTSFTGRELALILYCVAMVVLVISLRQHRVSMAKLKGSYPQSRDSVAAVLTIIVLGLATCITLLMVYRAYFP